MMCWRRPVKPLIFLLFLLFLLLFIYLLRTLKNEGQDYGDFTYHLPKGVPWTREPNGVPTESALYSLSRKDVSRIYYTYVNKKQVECGYIVRAGKVGDGGWDVCMDNQYKPSSYCLVYSFGINYDYSFDDSMADLYGCVVHSYDPSMNDTKDHLRGKRVHFHKTGLSVSNRINEAGWKMKTLSTILKENNHTQEIIDVLKFDIEYSELDAIPQMVESGALKNVKQVVFEMHLKLNSEQEATKEDYIYALSLLLQLYKEGFRIYGSHLNKDAGHQTEDGFVITGCHEIFMIHQFTNELRA